MPRFPDRRICALPWLGRAYEAAGRNDSAVAVYERYLATGDPDAASVPLTFARRESLRRWRWPRDNDEDKAGTLSDACLPQLRTPTPDQGTPAQGVSVSYEIVERTFRPRLRIDQRALRFNVELRNLSHRVRMRDSPVTKEVECVSSLSQRSLYSRLQRHR